jgi:formate hydrogenlyase subunit 5
MTATFSPAASFKRVELDALAAAVQDRFRARVSLSRRDGGVALSIVLLEPSSLPELCKFLFWDAGCSFGGLIVEERPGKWCLSYLFLAAGSGWIEMLLQVPSSASSVPSISSEVHAADWHEREAEDLFGLEFEGHPRLGDFVLHDQVWLHRTDDCRGNPWTRIKRISDAGRIRIGGRCSLSGILAHSPCQ